MSLKFDTLFRHKYDHERDLDLKTRFISEQPFSFNRCESCGVDDLSVSWTPDPYIEEMYGESVYFYFCGHCEAELIAEV